MRYLALTVPGPGGSVNFTAPGVPPGGPGALNGILGTAIELAILGAILACLFMLIWGGLDWITSQGDKQKVGKARDKLVMSVIGLIIIFTSYLILNILYAFFFGTRFSLFGG
jgi:hypothetical protein